MKNALTAVLLALALLATPHFARAQAINLGGSDSWEPVIRQAFIVDTGRASGADLGTFIGYAGGGQTPGETGMKNNFNGVSGANQVIAFFTRQLTDTGAAAPANICLLNPGAQDIVIGIDGIPNIGHPTRFGGVNPQLGNGTLTWQNVLSILYSGYDLTNPAAGNQCNSNVRRSLANDYASLFTGSGIPAGTPIRHIYRRGDPTATAQLFIQLLGVPAANRTWCNGTDFQDLDPIRRFALETDQVAEFDGTLGLVLSIVVPTFSNTLANLYTGANGTSPATSGKFLGGQGAACASGPSSIDISTAGPGVAATTYGGLAAPVPAELENLVRCDCRYPVPGNWPVASRNTPDAKRFSWNVKLGIGCQAPQAATSPSWGVLNGDDGTLENTPIAWGNRATAAVSAANVPYLPSGRARCCNVGSPAAFRRQDPRLVNLFVRNPDTGNLQGVAAPSTTAPLLAFYRLATTDQGISSVGRPFTPRCVQTLASDLQVSCLITSVPGDINSLGFGALPLVKDNAPAGLPPTQPFNLNTDPTAGNFASIRSRAYGLSRYVFLSSIRGFNALGESAAARTGSLTSYAYDTAGSAAQKQIDAQWNLAKAIYNDSKRPDRANAAVEQFGFLALNAGTDPYAVACTGDANDPGATKIALDNASYFLK